MFELFSRHLRGERKKIIFTCFAAVEVVGLHHYLLLSFYSKLQSSKFYRYFIVSSRYFSSQTFILAITIRLPVQSRKTLAHLQIQLHRHAFIRKKRAFQTRFTSFLCKMWRVASMKTHLFAFAKFWNAIRALILGFLRLYVFTWHRRRIQTQLNCVWWLQARNFNFANLWLISIIRFSNYFVFFARFALLPCFTITDFLRIFSIIAHWA